jgi:hypothetical protein
MCAECSRRCFLVRGVGAAAGLALGGLSFTGCNNQSRKGADRKMAKEMIAYCGLNCITCPIYLATREKNPEKQRQQREQIVIAIKKYLGEEKRLEDITDCDGCKSQGGRLYSGCWMCQIRKCASEKGLENCAYCSEYPCEKLSKFFDSEDPEGGAKKRLDAIKAQL